MLWENAGKLLASAFGRQGPEVQILSLRPAPLPTKSHGTGRQELAVVAVIDGKEEAGGARYIEFKVCRSPTDADRALGSWRFPESGTAIDQSKLGNTIEADFRFAVDCADQHGIPFVWVNDPDELFPPWIRPR
jgi:hypothetical protein